MKKWISLLRGINVGSSKRLTKDQLAELYSSLGFKNIEVIIQSGNVIFETTKGTQASLAATISKQLEKDYSYDVAVVVLAAPDLALILKGNPFEKEASKDPSKVLIGFLATRPDPKLVRALNTKTAPPNRFEVTADAIYLFCPNGVGRAKLPPFEKDLGVAVTFRNARVAKNLLEIARATAD